MWRLLWVVVVLVLVNGWMCSCNGYSREQERAALLQLKASINHPHGTSLPSWVEGKESFEYCQWERIQCNNSTGRVVQLSLHSVRSWSLGDWYLNASVFLPFEELKILRLDGNKLAGWFENEGSERLSSRLSNLEFLDLSINSLNNSILSSLNGLSSLKFLDLSWTNLQGLIHIEELNDCISLKELDISNNEIDSCSSIQGFKRMSPRLSSVETLHLSSNYLTNSSLSSLGSLSSLKYLDLNYNLLGGSIHIKDLEALTNLEELDLSANEVESFVNPKGVKSSSKLKVLHLDNSMSNTSILLQSLGAFSSLKTLYLQNNMFNRTINSQDLQDMSNLEEIFLDGSSLDKNFLQGIGVMTSLKIISLSNCGVNGTLPAQGWCELKSLQELDLAENGFVGSLPSCLGNLTSLRVLDLSNNQFTGNIASSPLTSLTSLEFLSFSNNHFNVPISFASFFNHSRLKVILSDSNRLVLDSEFQTRVPTFQLMVFSMSKTSAHLQIELNAPAAPPNFLKYQNDLRVIDLSHSNLTGKFPGWLFKNNTKLEGLFLKNNSFVGPLQLPSHPHPNIILIDVSKNNVAGQIPTNISSIFPRLSSLDMSKNVFEGSMPSFSSDMKSLEVLDLSDNQLSGEIPEHLAIACPSLMVFKLSNNKLQGQIFPKHVDLPTLEFLYLNGNNFVGKIPDSLVNSDWLIVLDISNNNLSGKLPGWMGKMSHLELIDLSGNHFEGPIPSQLCKLGRLGFMDLSENNVSGSIPSCFHSSAITRVHLNNNKLKGPMTRAFYNSSSLVTLDLSENNLHGKIPNWIGTLSALSILLLRANHFEGKIPVQICHLKQLSMMDFSQNNLSGTIPPCLSRIKFEATEEKIYLSTDAGHYTRYNTSFANVWKTEFTAGIELDRLSYPYLYSANDDEELVEFTTKRRTYSYKGRIMELMSGIDLSSNQLMGEIPPEIGNLCTIHTLNLSHNNLTGSIPTTFSNLQQTESLDLSYNLLNGTIPPQLTELYSLAVFSVAHNNLQGPTPNMKAQFATFDESSYEGNPLLFGPPLNKSCPRTGLPPPLPSASNSEEKEDTGFIDIDVFYVSFVVTYVIVLLSIVAILYINPYWRKVWFHFIEVGITSCYYFVLDNFLMIRLSILRHHV